MTKANDVLDFWFSLDNDAHFTKDLVLDATLKDRFGEALEVAKRGEYDAWTSTIDGALGLIILLDQFSRNIHRDTQKMFAGDAKALGIARQAIDSGQINELPSDKCIWFYMPFMHSEALADQERCIELCKAAKLENNISYAIEHADIIRRFGRFPHRNKILGRTSTPQEIDYLNSGGFSG